MHYFDGFRDQVADWTFDDWKDCLMNGTDKIRCEYCLDQNNRIKIFEVNSRSSEEVRIDPKIAKRCANISYGWTDYFVSCGIIIGLQVHIRRRTSFRRTCSTRRKTSVLFYSCEPADPTRYSTLRVEEGRPRMSLYKVKR